MPPALPHVDGVAHRFVDVDGLTMHVAEAGRGDPVVLLHTSFQHWYAWRGVIPALAERFRVICPDLRGCGWTAAPRRGYEKEQLAADIVQLLDVMGVPRARLVGHGLGGFVGFLLCLRHPERFERYLALAIVHPWLRLRPRSASLLLRAWYQGAIALPGIGSWLLRNHTGFVRWLLGGSSSAASPKRENEHIWTDEELMAFASLLRQRERAQAMVQVYRTFLIREFLPLVRGRYRALHLETPTLLLFGLEDVFFPPSALSGHEQHADDFSIELLPSEGHFLPQRNPQLVSERALTFFGDRG